MAAKNYKVILEVDIQAENPFIAAKVANDMVTRYKDAEYTWIIEDTGTKEVYKVDLETDSPDNVILLRKK